VICVVSTMLSFTPTFIGTEHFLAGNLEQCLARVEKSSARPRVAVILIMHHFGVIGEFGDRATPGIRSESGVDLIGN